jgi:hypothetical protein
VFFGIQDDGKSPEKFCEFSTTVQIPSCTELIKHIAEHALNNTGITTTNAKFRQDPMSSFSD